MLTPQEVSERAFQKASFGGYNMAQVDEFLNVLTKDYEVLYSENTVLKSKMKVLVDKVEEYRTTEDTMRKALMAAQRLASNLVKEAEEKRDQIMESAQMQAEAKVEEMRQEVHRQEQRLAAIQAEMSSYVSQVREIHSRAQIYLDQLDELCVGQAHHASTPPHQENHMDDMVSNIDDSLQRLVAQAMAEAALEQEPSEEPDSEEDLTPTTRFPPLKEERGGERREDSSAIDFGELQFGRDYEIT